MRPPLLISVAAFAAGLSVSGAALTADVPATPSDYKQQFATLNPGDTLVLAPGDYTDALRIQDVNGSDGLPITIEGPDGGSPARFVGKSGTNTIDIQNASYITIRNILFDGDGQAVDAIKAGGGAGSWSHHITIEGCTIINHDVNQTNQQIVGISTKIVSWDWTIRNNVIGDPSGGATSAGTGLYLGDSNGSAAFIGGVIEGNLVVDTLGYNMQIKHQNAREQVPGVPTEPRAIVIRHNVFIKSDNPSPDGGRPNLLVSGFPDAGDGSDDHIEIYGNFLFHNNEDSLLQASGRVHVHDNLFVDSANSAIRLVDHQGKTVIDGLVYNNTIYGTNSGISFSSAPSGISFVAGNAVFANQQIIGAAGEVDNILGVAADAATYVNNPSITLGDMDFYPLTGSALKGSAIDLSAVSGDVDYDRDFNGTDKDFTYRGAYSGEGDNPGWSPDATLKAVPPGAGGSGMGGGAGTGGEGSGTGASGAGASNGTGGGKANGGSSDEDDGCGCRAAGRRAGGTAAWLPFAALAWIALCRRRRVQR